MDAVTTNAQPALKQALPYIFSALSSTFSLASSLFSLISIIASKAFSSILVLSPLPIATYILAPVLVFFGVAFRGLFLVPLHFALYVLDVLYPVYVFCGVACICGGLIGLTARYISKLLVRLALEWPQLGVSGGGGRASPTANSGIAAQKRKAST